MFDAVKDHSVFIAENNVAVFAHKLHDKNFLQGSTIHLDAPAQIPPLAPFPAVL